MGVSAIRPPSWVRHFVIWNLSHQIWDKWPWKSLPIHFQTNLVFLKAFTSGFGQKFAILWFQSYYTRFLIINSGYYFWVVSNSIVHFDDSEIELLGHLSSIFEFMAAILMPPSWFLQRRIRLFVVLSSSSKLSPHTYFSVASNFGGSIDPVDVEWPI